MSTEATPPTNHEQMRLEYAKMRLNDIAQPMIQAKRAIDAGKVEEFKVNLALAVTEITETLRRL